MSQQLYKNVYQLVHKASGDPTDVPDAYSALENEQMFHIQPTKERKPILEHYQAFYDSIPKKPKSQQIKKRPRLLGMPSMKEDVPTERVASDSLGSPKAMIELKVSPSGHQMG